MNITIELNATPPAEISALPDDRVGPGTWVRFSTLAAHAMVWRPADHPEVFLLHWVESSVEGQGSVVMRAISEWADYNRLNGSLLCQEQMAPWYERFGWKFGGGFMGDVVMVREAS